MRKDLVRHSRFLSLVLRHQPEAIGLTLDAEGWASVDELLERCASHERPIDRAMLDEIVRTNDKGRFAFSEDGERIRARQGHSIEVDLGLEPASPPAVLFHGTVERAIASIRAEGLKPGARQHVHLSAERETAVRVGARRGDPVVLEIDAAGLAAEGVPFFLSENGVWLTAHVPPRWIRFP